MVFTCLKQNTFSCCRLASVNMGHNPDITHFVQCYLSSQTDPPESSSQKINHSCVHKTLHPLPLHGCSAGEISKLRQVSETKNNLPPEVRERLVGFCHSVRFFLLFDRSTCAL